MNILGVFLDYPFLRISQIRKDRRGIEISEQKEIPLIEIDPPPKKRIKNPLKSAILKPSPELKPNPKPSVKQLYIESFKGRIVSGLSAKKFLIRSLDVNITKGRHMEELISFQSETLSYLSKEEILTVPILEKKQKGKIEALCYTVPKEAFYEHLNELKELHIDPDVVSTVPSALCQFIHWKFPKLESAFIVDLGSSEITCALLEKGQLKKSHAVMKGIESLLEALYNDRKRILLKPEIEGAAKQIDLLLLKPGLNPHLSDALNWIRQELAKIYYSSTKGLAQPIIFTGKSDTFIHLREFLMDFSEESYPLTLEEQKFAISLGLALDQTTKHALQLRREEFFPQKNWVKMGAAACLLLTLSIVLSISLIFIGMRSAEMRKKEMLKVLNVPSVSHIPMEDQIDIWIDEIEKNNKEFPYILTAPKALEVFSWLSSHPLLETLKNEGDPIDIRELKYELVSYPTAENEKEPFLTKVEIEFRFKYLTNARKFHEALRSGDTLVDPNLEISWDALSKGYRASFFTKTRRPHVS